MSMWITINVSFCVEGPILQESLDLSADPKSSKQVRSAPPPGLLRLGRTGVDLLEDPIVGIVKSLNRCILQLRPQ